MKLVQQRMMTRKLKGLQNVTSASVGVWDESSSSARVFVLVLACLLMSGCLFRSEQTHRGNTL